MHTNFEIMIDAPLEEVLNHYMSHESRLKWDKNLKEIRKVTEEDNSYLLIYQEKDGLYAMKETIENEDLPDAIEHHYSVDGAKKVQRDFFMPYDNKSIWVVNCNFLFDHYTNLPKALFEQKIKDEMHRFKMFIEETTSHSI